MSIWKPGQPISASKLNRHSAESAGRDMGGFPGSVSTIGNQTAFNIRDLSQNGMWIRVFDGKQVDSEEGAQGPTQTGVWQYSWEGVWWDNIAKRWQRNESAFGHVDSDPATATDRGTLTSTSDTALDPTAETQDVKPYLAARDPVTGRLVVLKPGDGGGNVEIKSGDTRLMILGTYDQYKDCEGVPPKPPTTWSDGCMTSRTTTLCVPAYAYAVYQRCGYIWKKIGDTRTFGVWANETNGGSTSSWRRFHAPCWGGDRDPVTWIPDPLSDCIGVSFEPASAGALTCSCPPCLASPPEGLQLCFKFRTIVRPDNPMECTTLKNEMDANSAWDKDYVIPLTKVSGYCSATGVSDDGIFTVNWDWQDGSQLECDWGPAEFDPCDPCEHWGRLYSYIDVPGGNEPNCGGAGVWRGEFKAREICKLICDCEAGPVSPWVGKFCNGCGNSQVPPAIWNVIKEGTIEIACCTP